ncbi:MAG: hypothetical protein ACK4NC_02285 [Candidatus Gracilibacteria bacterium]
MKNVMKHLVLAGVISIGLLTFVSCGNSNENSNASLANQESIELKGQLVHPTPPSDTDFLLKMDGGSEVNLTSTLVSLEKYFNQAVVVSGYYKNDEKTIFEVLSVGENTNMNQNSITGGALQTYASNTLGIRFQYPAAWSVDEKETTKISLVTKENGESILEIFRIVPKVNQTLSNWIGINYKDAEVIETEFGDVEGIRIATDDSNEEIILIAKNSYFYTVHFKYSGKELEQNLVIRQFAELGNSFEFFVPGTLPVQSTNQNTSDDTFSTTSITTGSNPSGEEFVLPNKNSNQSTTTSPSTPTPVPAANVNQNTSASTNTSAPTSTAPTILSYLKQNSYMLPQGVDSSTVSKIEIAGGKYVYVTYKEGEDTKKVAYSYADNGDGTYKVSQQGLFKIDPATSKWTTLGGVNPAPNSNREVYAVASSGAPEKTADVAEGKNLYANDKTGVKVQFPNNWYYQGSTLAEKGGVQQVTFSSKPLDENPEEQVTLKVYTSAGVDLTSASKTTVGGVSAYEIEATDGTTQYAVKGTDGKVYVTTGGSSEHMAEILKSVSK